MIYEQELLFSETKKATSARDKRNAPNFLRNQFPGIGKFGIPTVKRQLVSLENVGLIACTNTRLDDQEYFDFGVHFFVTMTLAHHTRIPKKRSLFTLNIDFA